jgi:NADH-quinone oxidoreductase subunit B
MPSSWWFDKARRREWERAAAHGREEQLRIERWMERTGGGR